MKIRIKFRKYGVMKFIGHLDIMRFFQKAMRRADIPIAFTGGFSPHMIMSFANPLGVGVTSDGEYFDIELSEEINMSDAVIRMNAVSVEGTGAVTDNEIHADMLTGDFAVDYSQDSGVLVANNTPAMELTYESKERFPSVFL